MASLAEMKELVMRVAMPGEAPCELGEDDDLLESGVLDSLSILQVALEIERAFGARAKAGEIGREHFGTIRRLTAFVAGRQGAGRHGERREAVESGIPRAEGDGQ